MKDKPGGKQANVIWETSIRVTARSWKVFSRSNYLLDTEEKNSPSRESKSPSSYRQQSYDNRNDTDPKAMAYFRQRSISRRGRESFPRMINQQCYRLIKDVFSLRFILCGKDSRPSLIFQPIDFNGSDRILTESCGSAATLIERSIAARFSFVSTFLLSRRSVGIEIGIGDG